MDQMMNKSYEKTAYIGMNLVRNKSNNTLLDMVSLAATAYKIKKEDIYQKDALQALVDQEFKNNFDVKGHLFGFINTFWDEIVEYSHAAELKDLKAVALMAQSSDRMDDSIGTPRSITKIADKLLALQRGDTFVDQCSGPASLMTYMAIKHQGVSFWGNEINTTNVVIMKIRSWLLDNVIQVKQGNAVTEDLSELGANKLFSDHPWGMRYDQMVDMVRKDSRYAPYLEAFPKSKILDWAFVLAAVFNRKKDGTSVVVVPTGMLSRTMRSEETIRTKLTQQGYLKSVISLPAKLYPTTALKVSILVLSSGNKDGVRMVDGTKLGNDSKIERVLSEDDINTIMEWMDKDSEHSVFVSTEQLRQNAYSWNPARYLTTGLQTVENGMTLKALSVGTGRGKTIPRAELESLTSDTATKYQYLMLQDIVDNRVVDSLTSLTAFNEQYTNVLVHKNDLLISRTAPFKVAIMPEIDGRKIIANGNFFMYSLNSDIINPLYAMLYLRSARGQQQLNFAAHGSALVSLSNKDLESLEIPMIPKDEQDKIVESYLSLVDELDIIKRQEKLLYDKIDGLMD